jgi:SAM-dependent methyltransferase
MVPLPAPDTYEKEFKYMPWGTLVERVVQEVEQETPANGSVLDLMCGPGYLLREIGKKRSDIQLSGVDISEAYINYARKNVPNASFQQADVSSWSTDEKYHMIICTGGIHHLPYDQQAHFIEGIPALLHPNGTFISGDPYISRYTNEKERESAAAVLGYKYLAATYRMNAPHEVILAAIDILGQDVDGLEYKTSLSRIEPIFGKVFPQVKRIKIWPTFPSEFGEYLVIGKMGRK